MKGDGERERVRATCNAIKKVVFSDYSLCGGGFGGGWVGDGQMHGQAWNIPGERGDKVIIGYFEYLHLVYATR